MTLSKMILFSQFSKIKIFYLIYWAKQANLLYIQRILWSWYLLYFDFKPGYYLFINWILGTVKNHSKSLRSLRRSIFITDESSLMLWFVLVYNLRINTYTPTPLCHNVIMIIKILMVLLHAVSDLSPWPTMYTATNIY